MLGRRTKINNTEKNGISLKLEKYCIALFLLKLLRIFRIVHALITQVTVLRGEEAGLSSVLIGCDEEAVVEAPPYFPL